MTDLAKTFEQRIASERNGVLLHNLQLISNADEALADEVVEPFQYVDTAAMVARQYAFIDAHGAVPKDREVAELLEFFSIEPGEIVDFAQDGLVVDVGAGQSNFLDLFTGTADTIAIDVDEEALAYQAAHHQTIQTSMVDLEGIEPESVRVLHAAYSAPFWLDSPEQSWRVAERTIEVLEPGGIGLVGAISDGLAHGRYERAVSRAIDLDEPVTIDIERSETRYMAHVRTSFATALLSYVLDREVELAGARSVPNNRDGYRQRPDVHVPNFLVFRRVE